VIKKLKQVGQAAPINQSFYALLEFLDQKIREEARR